MGMCLCKEAKNCNICKFTKSPFAVCFFLCSRINNVHFLQCFYQADHIILSTFKFRRLHNCIVFVSIKVSTRSIINVFKYKSDCNVDFGYTFQLVEHVIQFHVEEYLVIGWLGKLKHTVSFFLQAESQRGNDARIRSTFSWASSVPSSRVSISRLDILIGNPCWLLLCARTAKKPEETVATVTQ